MRCHVCCHDNLAASFACGGVSGPSDGPADSPDLCWCRQSGLLKKGLDESWVNRFLSLPSLNLPSPFLFVFSQRLCHTVLWRGACWFSKMSFFQRGSLSSAVSRRTHTHSEQRLYPQLRIRYQRCTMSLISLRCFRATGLAWLLVSVLKQKKAKTRKKWAAEPVVFRRIASASPSPSSSCSFFYAVFRVVVSSAF